MPSMVARRARGALPPIRGGGWFRGAAQRRSAQRIPFDPRFRCSLSSRLRVLREAPAG